MKIKAKKGCIESDCLMCKKKIYFDNSVEFCTNCNNLLSFVCKKCHTVLEDGSKKLCIGCQAKVDDNKERRNQAFKKAITPISLCVPAVAAIVFKKKQ